MSGGQLIYYSFFSEPVGARALFGPQVAPSLIIAFIEVKGLSGLLLYLWSWRAVMDHYYIYGSCCAFNKTLLMRCDKFVTTLIGNC